jgi:CRISPR-associated exonuclease Cas4
MRHGQAWADNRFTAEGNALHELMASRVTPTAEYQPRRCDACSLIEFCQPKALRLKRGAAAWFENSVKADHQTAFTGESEA